MTPSGRLKPAIFDQFMLPGLKNGRKISAVRGSIDRMPSTVAKRAPRLSPKCAGRYMPTMPMIEMISTVSEIGEPPTPEKRLNFVSVLSPNSATM